MTSTLAQLASQLTTLGLDGYLVTDFRGSSLTLPRLVPPVAGEKRWTTRRVGLLIGRTGKPILATSAIDQGQFLPAKYPELEIRVFVSWEQWQAFLVDAAKACPRLAMDYSPGCALPVVSTADAGTVEFVRAAGAEVVSSGDLLQTVLAQWNAPGQTSGIEGHERASTLVGQVRDEAFGVIRDALKGGETVREHEVAEFIERRFGELGLESRDRPVVAVGEHAADPHFEPTDRVPTAIRAGDMVLMDLWARLPGEANIFSDITWMGICGQPSARQLEVYTAVRDARDASLALAQQSWAAGKPVRGCDLDDSARNLLVQRGMSAGIKHRTGHSLSPGPLVHGVGMNLDNLETRDTRRMLPGTGFTIEPGVYLASERIGVRSEINVYVDPKRGPIVTSAIQRDLVQLM